MTESGTGAAVKGFLQEIGVVDLAPATSPFDPGYDPYTLEGHLTQSAHLISILKISMACWLIADEGATRRKTAACKAVGVPTVAGGSAFEIAVVQDRLDEYLDLCADVGMTRIEAGEGFTDMPLAPKDVLRKTDAKGLEVQFELGRKLGGIFTSDAVDGFIAQGREWLDAGAKQLVIEARESAQGVGLFDEVGAFDAVLADRLADAFGLPNVVFEAPTKHSQFLLLDHFGAEVRLSNVRLEELLRVEIYRRGLHADAWLKGRLRPPIRARA